MEKAFSSINIEESHYNSIKFAAKYFDTNVKYKYVEKSSWLRYISSLDIITTIGEKGQEIKLESQVRRVSTCRCNKSTSSCWSDTTL